MRNEPVKPIGRLGLNPRRIAQHRPMPRIERPDMGINEPLAWNHIIIEQQHRVASGALDAQIPRRPSPDMLGLNHLNRKWIGPLERIPLAIDHHKHLEISLGRSKVLLERAQQIRQLPRSPTGGHNHRQKLNPRDRQCVLHASEMIHTAPGNDLFATINSMPTHTTTPTDPSHHLEAFSTDPEHAMQRIERFDRWIVTAAKPTSQAQLTWSQWIIELPAALESIPVPDAIIDRAQTLRDLHLAYQRIPDALAIAKTWKTDAIKAHRWAQIESKLIDQAIHAVILIGNGQHTAELINTGWPTSSIAIRCIIDDHPKADHLGTIPIVTPDQLARYAASGCVILPSSDAYEDQLIEKTTPIAKALNLPIWRIYTDPHTPHPSHDQIARTLPIPAHRTTTFTPLDPHAIDPAPRHRSALGLEATRPWADTIADVLRFPTWARGHINTRDACFLWDLIEASAKRATDELSILEIGTASGVSTAALAQGARQLSNIRAHIHAFDVLAYCYFDPTRRVGDAAGELAPDLTNSITIHTPQNARDAAAHLPPHSVDLALIDADHRHPAAAIDLLTILPILKPGAWVLIHDIELDLIQSNTPTSPGAQSGPHLLYQAWAYDKVRELRDDPRESNIGALKIPEHPFDAQRLLLDLIQNADGAGNEHSSPATIGPKPH